MLMLQVPSASAGAVAPSDGCTNAGVPLGKYGGTLSFQLASMSPLVVTSTGETTLTVSGTYTNTGQQLLTDVGYKFQRGDPLGDEAAIRKEVADPCQPVTVINTGFEALPGQLVPGLTAGFTARVPITGDSTSTLSVDRPGVYPIMININATVHLPDGAIRARVGELHLLLTVLSVPDRGDGVDLPGGQPTTSPAVPFNMLWPIVDRPHLGVGGVFLDDDLVAEISPGGRLSDLVDTLTTAQPGSRSVTLVLDPELLDELDRMAGGYWVVKEPGTPQPALTPTRNGSTTSTPAPTSTPVSAAPSSTPSPTTSTDTSTETSTSTGTTETSTTGGASGQNGGTGAGAEGPSGSVQPGNGAGGGGAGGGDSRPTQGTAGGAGRTGPAGIAGAAAEATGEGTRPGGGGPGTGPNATDSGIATTGPAAATSGTTSSSETGPSTTDGQATETPVTASSPSPATTSAATPPTPAGPGPGPQPPGTVAGTGSAAAAQYLDRLRTLARTYQVLVLPYSDPDSVALVRAGMGDRLASAVYLGRAVAERVLQQGVPVVDPSSNLVTDVAFPVGGTADEATLQALSDLGYTSAVLSTTAVSGGSPRGAVPVRVGGGSMPALVSDASLLADIGSFVYSGIPADWASRVNVLAAVLAEQHFDGTGTPMVLIPDRDWSPNRDGVQFIDSLLQVMAGQGVVSGTPLDAIAAGVAGRRATATLTYSDSAEQAELPQSYLNSIREIADRIQVLQLAFSPTPGPEGADPAAILEPLQRALTTAASASFRTADDLDGPVLQTVNDTLDGLYGGVTIRSIGGSYTLASSSSPLLLTLQNTLPYQVSVGVDIIGGGRVGLSTQDPGRLEIAAGPRTKQIKLDAEVSRSGTFTVYAQLRGPDGAAWGAAVPLTIASRAYGALTLVLILVAGGVLVLMVGFRIHQRWRAHRARSAAGGSQPDTPDPDSISGAEPLPPGPSDGADAAGAEPDRAGPTGGDGSSAPAVPDGDDMHRAPATHPGRSS
jgi:hypothetical protein